MGTEVKKISLSQYSVFLFVLVFSALVLTFSYSSQYIWGIEPCKLCKLQRLPYFVVICLSALAFRLSSKRALIGLIQFSFLLGLGLACYHLLVIGGIVADPCFVPTDIASLEDFQCMLDAPLPCSKTAWRMLGIPLAGYNAICSFCSFLILAKKFANYCIH